MANSIEYRQRAEEERRLASVATLPMVKLIHDKAADRWICLAESAELSEVAGLAAVGRVRDVFY